MKTSKTIVLATAAALIAAVALPAGAAADYYVPPGNSAVNQYTESIPGAGGESGGKKKDVTPAQALGAANAKKLEQRGQAGEEAAEVAAETAPSEDLFSTASGGSGGQGNGGGNQGGGGSTSGGSGGSSAGGASGGPNTSDSTIEVSQPSGSSGISSVLGQATGATDEGNIGLWLPLAILAILAGAIAYRVRLRQHGPTA
ncbi:MAG: hypothetical protein QOF13_1464 [Solirubrobacterales bacterium]|jgi:hypothetical protein|nr:hypothetical protein [Solirubrobacterales bacterium]